ncbi:MAG: non-canonical purine NTP diphosphatase [Paludibacteraceae bacterium]|nr:non-canonical purine NTP diphosphatase [Paludibacteraceae bacterium]MBO7317085.1 non-canonical purine NTP diphosphatase [Paludibacteraceae bacterium]
MKKLVFVTNNAHKLSEAKAILNNKVEICSLKEIGCFDEIEETGINLNENAEIKANYVYSLYNLDTFADDTGLEVEALNGAPGVYSARYAGEDGNSEKNIQKLLTELNGKENRKAQFRTVIALIENGEKHFFEGIVKGKIIDKRKGDGGFGYDSVFIPDGYDKTFAELEPEVKNSISHRAKAMQLLVNYFNQKQK